MLIYLPDTQRFNVKCEAAVGWLPVGSHSLRPLPKGAEPRFSVGVGKMIKAKKSIRSSNREVRQSGLSRHRRRKKTIASR